MKKIDFDRVDWNRVDDMALAIMYLTLHDECRVWKGVDWDITDRLHDKGLISNPRSKAKSVIMTDEAIERARQIFSEAFVKDE